MNPIDAPNLNYAWCGLIVEELTRLGVAGFVVSPGSRNSPLSICAVSQKHARHWVHFDERGAGFFALGLARRGGGPAVLICTSGSAAANYWPAVVEAEAAGVPLIVITADRPPELLDCGANQAIDQVHLYGRYTRWSATLPCPDKSISPAYVLTTVDQAHARSLGPDAGPVHLNVMLREPLAPAPDGSAPANWLDTLTLWRAGRMPHTRISTARATLDEDTVEAIAAIVQTAACGMLVAGALNSASETTEVAAFARRLGWPLFADVCSTLRGHPDLPCLLTHGDLVLLDENLGSEWWPDAVLHLGGSVVSKRVQQLLERARPRCVRVAPGVDRLDPGHLVEVRVPLTAGAFCRILSDRLDHSVPPRPLPASLVVRNDHCRAVIDAWHGGQDALSEAAVARLVAEQAPAHSLIFLGNSMPVRLVDSFGTPLHPDVAVAANRGASGIDGNIATAAGMAVASGRPAVALVGDLTALHDLNSLALLREVESPFALIVLNNDGGGIFHHLPIARHDVPFERCFGTPHGLNFPGAATMFNLPYRRPSDLSEFSAALDDALATAGATVIEVVVDRGASRGVLEDLHGRLKGAMARRGGENPGLEPLVPVHLSGERGRPPLLLLHGFLGGAEDWMPAASVLGTDFHVLAINLPGHGPGWDRDLVEAQGMAACAAGIVAGLDEAGIAHCALAGYSMGGRIALYLALRYPERFGRVVLESGSPGLDTPEKRKARAAQDGALAQRLAEMEPRSGAFRSFLEEWYKQPIFSTLQQQPELLAQLVAWRHAHGAPALLARSLRALGTGVQPDLWPELPDLKTPTLLIVGEEDRKFRIIAEDMCRACPAMAMEVFSGCGHNVHLENLGGWLTAVRAFLKSA